MEIWTAIACLAADPACKGFRRFGDEGKGAYVNIAASAASESEFRERVNRIVPTLDCILLELDGVQLLETAWTSQTNQKNSLLYAPQHSSSP